MTDALPLPQAATELGIGLRSLQKLVKIGKIQVYRPVPRRAFIPRDAISRFKKEHTK